MSILLKALLGGLMTAFIAWASTKGNVLPGILPMFPTLTLIALTIVGTQGDAQDFYETCIATLKTLPAYVVFVLVCTVAIKRVSFRATLLLGLGGWLLAAVIAFLVPRLWQRVW
jgi:membrane protein GlpM